VLLLTKQNLEKPTRVNIMTYNINKMVYVIICGDTTAKFDFMSDLIKAANKEIENGNGFCTHIEHELDNGMFDKIPFTV
jgi:hypothetical protein